jgi:tetratricopeptide (TPR) repeat protein
VKRRGLSIEIPFFLLLLAAGSVSVDGQAASDPARSQADAFLKQATMLEDSGSAEAAGALIGSALELAPDYSEALYARGRLRIGQRVSTMAGLTDLRAALQHGSWSTSDPTEAELLLGQTLLRTGSVAEARAVAQRLANLHPENGRILLLLARVQGRSGDSAAEQKTLSEAAQRFPDMDEIRLLNSSLLERQGRRAAAVEAVATGLKFHPDSLILLLAAARLERDPKKQAAAVELYGRKGGIDPLADVLGLESAPAAERKRHLALFLSHSGLTRQDLIDRVIAAVKSNKELAATLQSALSSFSGSRDLDADADGYWEERWDFDAGKIIRWTREPAENGIAQYASDFRAGRPATLTYQASPDVRLTLAFSSYPFFEKAAEANGPTFFIVPYSLQCVFLQPAAANPFTGLSPRIASRFAVPTFDQIRKASSRSEEYAADGITVLRRTSLSRGLAIFMEEDANGDGRMEHRLWYVNGAPSRGERSLDGTTLFQVKESWKDGKLASDTYDTDGDGISDFRETFGMKSMKAWDYNEDGRDDSREFPGPGGTVVREISTALNGIFDVSVRTIGGRIVGVTRAGAALEIAADATRGVTWIGTPASANLRPDALLPDGLQVLGTRSYLVFRLEGTLYAEEVK